MANYRVRRDLGENHYTMLKSSTLPECKRVVRSLKGKWDDVKDVPMEGEEPFETNLKNDGRELVVTQGERIVDRYIVEKV